MRTSKIRTTAVSSNGVTLAERDLLHSIARPSATVGGALPAFAQMTEWREGLAPRALDGAFDRDVSGDAFLCVEIKFGSDPVATTSFLQAVCSDEITIEMVEDLLDTDLLPKVKQWPGVPIRTLCAAGSRAVEGRDKEVAHDLRFDVVEFLAGHDWIVVCCHAEHTFGSLRAGSGPERQDCSDLLAQVERAWLKEGASTAGDLGVLILKQLVLTYRSTRRYLEQWIEEWELDFYRRRECDDELAKRRLEELHSLRRLIAKFRQQLDAMNVDREDAAESWFLGVSLPEVAARADRLIDESLARVEHLTETLREGFDLQQSQIAARQLELQLQQGEQAERLQRKIELVGSLFLVPTLIAGIFGANTALPGGNNPHAWLGFELMLVAMVIGAAVVAYTFKRFRSSSSASKRVGPGSASR